MKDNIVAKLSAHADDLFAEGMKLMQKESVRTLWDKEWLPIVSGKQAFYSGLSHYFQSKVCNANKSVGEEIARLQHCIELFTACQQRSRISFFIFLFIFIFIFQVRDLLSVWLCGLDQAESESAY